MPMYQANSSNAQICDPGCYNRYYGSKADGSGYNYICGEGSENNAYTVRGRE